MINKLFEYPALERVEKNDVRYYRDSKENLVPSVTTILSATGDHSGIDAWKRRVGPKLMGQPQMLRPSRPDCTLLPLAFGCSWHPPDPKQLSHRRRSPHRVDGCDVRP